MTAKKIPAKKAAAKKAAKVAKKTPTKTATKKYVPPGKLAKKAAKAATKKVATKKTAPAKKPSSKAGKIASAKRPATSSAPKTLTQSAPAKKTTGKNSADTSKAKAPRSDKPIDATRPTLNGVLRPHAKSVAGGLWKIADDLREKLKRAPARFEFRAKVTAENEKIVANGGTPYADNSVSFHYFKWRTFNGVKGREVGLYPKRNSFELSVPVVRTPRAPKAAPASVPAAPAVSSRLASISEAAATGDA